MKILVTGASGFLGGNLYAGLRKENEVWAASRRRLPHIDPSRWIDPVNPSIAGGPPDAIIHAVSLNHKDSEKSWPQALEVGVGNTIRWLEKASEWGTRIFIYLSTQQVYGKIAAGEKLSEERLPQPENIYGLTHLQSEAWVAQWGKKAPSSPEFPRVGVSFRISNGFGPAVSSGADYLWLVIHDFCLSLLQKNQIEILSDGRPERDFIFVDDILGAVQTVLNRAQDRVPIPSPIHLGSGHTRTILETAFEVLDVFHAWRPGSSARIICAGKEFKLGDRAAALSSGERFTYDVSRLKSLGFQARTEFRDGIRKFFEART